MLRRIAVLLALAALVGACGDSDPDTNADAGTAADAADASAALDTMGDAADAGSDAVSDADASPEAPFAELEGIIDRYRGAAPPSDEVTDDGVTTYTFDVEDGPICLYGEPYRMAVRDVGAEDLMIFLQGGGACWSSFCFAIDYAPPGMPSSLDILDPEHPTNPARDWNVAYLPYCDGSLFAGDADIDEDGDGEVDRWQRGLRNLTAALDVAAERFPAPRRVLFAGSSGGGFGTIVALPLVRMVWPDAEIIVFNDAGVGVVKGEEPEFLDGLVDEFNARDLVPASCGDCLAGGHLAPLIGWELERDPNLRIAAFSTYGDSIIAGIFLRLTQAAFKEALLEQTGALAEAFPGRYAAFLAEGTAHTALLGDVRGFLGDDAGDSPIGGSVDIGSMDEIAVDGVTVATWFQWFVDGDPSWGQVEE